jgi:hypothetical protein
VKIIIFNSYTPQDKITNETRKIKFEGHINVTYDLPAILELLRNLPAHVEEIILYDCWTSQRSALEAILSNIPPTIKLLTPDGDLHRKAHDKIMSVFTKLNNKTALNLFYLSSYAASKLPNDLESLSTTRSNFISYYKTHGSLSNLTSLTIIDGYLLTDGQLIGIFAATPNLTHLDLGEINFLSTGVAVWKALPPGLKVLRGVDVFSAAIQQRDFISSLRTPDFLKTIKTLTISGQDIRLVNVRTLQALSNLTSLTITHCDQLTDEQLISILAATPNLTHLDLSDIEFINRGVALWKALPPRLIELRIPQLISNNILEHLIGYPHLRKIGFKLIEDLIIHANTPPINQKLAQYLTKQVVEAIEDPMHCLVFEKSVLNYEITPGILQRLLMALRSINTAESLFVYGLLKEGRIPSIAPQTDLTNVAFNVSRVLNAIGYYRQALAKSVPGTRLFDACSTILSHLTPEEKNLQATMDELKRCKHHLFFREIDSAPSSESNKVESRQLQTGYALTFSEKDFNDYCDSDTEVSFIDDELLELLEEQYPINGIY